MLFQENADTPYAVMRIEIPEIHSDFAGFNEIANISRRLQNARNGAIVFDFRHCAFFDGNMTAPLQIVIDRFAERLARRSVNVQFEHLSQDVEHALRRNHFLRSYGYTPLPDYDRTSLPLRHFYCYDRSAYYPYLGVLVKMIEQPKMTPALTKELQRSLFEIMENACGHARSSVGFYCCTQYFPSDQKLRFSFSDGGVGIRKNVNDFTGRNFTDTSAIEWAIKHGNSTKPTEQKIPGGLGLGIVRQFVSLNRGKLCVISGDGFYNVVPEEPPRVLHNNLPGTTIHLEINTADANTYYLGTGEKL